MHFLKQLVQTARHSWKQAKSMSIAQNKKFITEKQVFMSMKVLVSSALKVLTPLCMNIVKWFGMFNWHYDSFLFKCFPMQKSHILMTLPENAQDSTIFTQLFGNYSKVTHYSTYSNEVTKYFHIFTAFMLFAILICSQHCAKERLFNLRDIFRKTKKI